MHLSVCVLCVFMCILKFRNLREPDVLYILVNFVIASCKAIDFIDYCTNEQRNVYGQVMRWIMVVKDHFTGLCYLRAIPNKNAKYVCFELNSLFGLIGYPHIFHTDNGSEFTAEQVVGMLKRWNQTILTVTGRPRKPSDQGSVEIINRLVKRVMNSVLASEVQKRPNTLEKLIQI